MPGLNSKKYKYYEFPKIEETIYQQQSISKYEIPQYIQEIPEGFSIFCTLWEAGKVKQYMQLSKEEKDRLGIRDKEEIYKDNDIIKKMDNNIRATKNLYDIIRASKGVAI